VKIAIIGTGVVGRAQAEMFRAHDRVTYDITDLKPYPLAAISKCDFAVICVGTPPAPGGSCDLSQVAEALDALPERLPVLLRSTVPPGTTDCIAGRPACYAPEFLHEREGGAWHRSVAVPWMILGGRPAARRFFRRHLEQVFPGQIWDCPALTAELAKYAANLYWATRVTFVNEMAAVSAACGGDWEEVRTAWLMDKRVNPVYTAMDGFGPGFGGRCWPKDLSALIAASSDNGHEPWFLDAVRLANERFRL
jgi:UDPglucose 6-dehydrogenase